MATTGADSKQTGAAPEGGEDRISALPDAILEQVLSILPAHEAVRSSVLSRRWHVLWNSLRITEPDSLSSAANFSRFVNQLPLLRSAWSLREVELCGPYSVDSNAFFLENIGSKESVRHVEERIGHAVVCDVQVLRVLVSSQPIPCCSSACPDLLALDDPAAPVCRVGRQCIGYLELSRVGRSGDEPMQKFSS
jgi:hypothetical protein